jgi:hypothetical protein
MYTADFRIYFEDGTVEIRQGKVFPRPREEEREGMVSLEHRTCRK